jgi:hypothetical protein
MDFDEIGSNVKGLFKNKKFVVLCIIVGAIAIILWIIKQNRKATATTEETGYYDGTQAIGYGGYGYPTVGDESGATDYDWLYDRFDALDERFTDMMTAMEEGNATQDERWQGLFDALNDRIDGLGEDDEDSTPTWSGGGSYHPKQEEEVDIQAVIDAMEMNSNAWWDVSDQAGRDYLHNENQYLASLIGANYDSSSGQWMINGTPLYSVNKGNAENYYTTTGQKTGSSSYVGYTTNVDYQAAINEGLRTGSLTAAQINALNDERDKKITSKYDGSTGAANASFDPNTDYQALINNAKAIGANQSVIDNLTAQRNAKIAAQSSSKSSTKTTQKSSSSGYTVSTNRNPVYKTGKSSATINSVKSK